MTAPPGRSGADRRRRRTLRARALVFAALAVGSGLTGWWWSEHLDRAGDQGPSGWDLVGLVAGVVVLGVWGARMLATGRRSVEVPPTLGALPSTHSPAEVGWLLRHGRVTLADLAATIVDLTGRGFVLPFRRDEGLVLGRGRPVVDLRPHEDLVLEWLFAGWAREADLEAKRAAIRADPVQWSALWVRFVDDVEALGRDSGLIEREVASPGVLAVAAAGLGVLVVGVTGTAHGYVGWLACVVAGSVVLAGASAFARRSSLGDTLAMQWEAFGSRLREGADITPHALAYAVTLGEGDAAAQRLAAADDEWPAQLIHAEVERQLLGWQEAFLVATSVRGEPSERVRAALSLRSLRRREPSPA